MEQTISYNKTEGAEIPFHLVSYVMVYGCFLVALLGIPGNFLVILAVMLSKRVQNVSSVFIVNLAVADLINCGLSPVFSFVQLQRRYSCSLEPICKVLLVVVHTCIGVSMYTLSAIALNRFLVVVVPRWVYDAVYRGKYVAFQISVMWFVPTSVSIVPSFFFGIGQQGYDFYLHTCAPVKNHPTTSTFNSILTVVLFPVPLLLILVSYLGILLKVRKHNKRLSAHGVTRTSGGKSSENLQRSEMESCEDETNRPSATTAPFSKVEMQVTMNLFIIFVAYILCLTPQAICNVVTCPIDENVTRYIVLLNSVINPFIYGVKHPLFRSIFICILRCRKVPEPSTFLTSTIRILQRT